MVRKKCANKSENPYIAGTMSERAMHVMSSNCFLHVFLEAVVGVTGCTFGSFLF